jgi:hypothetical protein
MQRREGFPNRFAIEAPFGGFDFEIGFFRQQWRSGGQQRQPGAGDSRKSNSARKERH